MEVPPTRRFRMDGWDVDPMANTVRRLDDIRRLEPLAMSVLVVLASRQGQVISKDELVRSVWGDVAVTDSSLVRTIALLRRALDDDWKAPRYIETINKRGYRLLARVTYDVPLQDPVAQAQPGLRSRSRVAVAFGLIALLSMAAGVVWWSLLDPPLSRAFDPQPLTTYRGSEIQPALSPDGGQLAFVWDGPDRDNWDVYLKSIGSSSATRLTRHPGSDANPTWSPDASHIAFTRYQDDSCGIYRVPTLGGNPRLLTPCSNRASVHLTWSPDGSALAFSDYSPEGASRAVFLLGLESGKITRLTFPPSHLRGDIDPVFAPDGKVIVFRRIRSEGRHDLFSVSVSGGEPRRLTFIDRNIDGHDWHPETGGLVFSRRQGPHYRLWQVSRQGSGSKVIPIVDTQVHNPTLARHRNRLVYSRAIQDVNLWRLTRDSSGAFSKQPLFGSTRWDLHPSIAPDQKRIAFTSDRSGSHEIWVGDASAPAATRLTFMDGPFTGVPRWSPDSRRLVFESRLQGHADLFLIDAAGGEATRLTRHGADDLAGSWSQDGRSVYFASNRQGGWQVWNLRLRDRHLTQVTQDGGFAPRESEDGRFLYFTRYDTAGLWRMPTGRETDAQRLVSDLSPADWGNWALTRQGIVYLARSPSRVLLHDPETGTTQPIAPLSGVVPGLDPALSVSDDGGWLVLGQIDRDESDLMLVDDFNLGG